MTTPAFTATPAAPDGFSQTFLASDGTAAKVLISPLPPAAANAATQQPMFQGGGVLLDVTATSTDTTDKAVTLWEGDVLTPGGAGTTGAVTTTTNTIVRTFGSFVTDSWKPGAIVMMFADDDEAANANNGIQGIVTAVSTLNLTVNGTPFSALTMPTDVRICRMSRLHDTAVPASAGSSGPSVSLVNSALDGSTLLQERKLGLKTLLAASMAAAVSALPAYVSLRAQALRY